MASHAAVPRGACLPPQVDVLVSEPMGTLLVNERMIESYVYARDKFLKPGGEGGQAAPPAAPAVSAVARALHHRHAGAGGRLATAVAFWCCRHTLMEGCLTGRNSAAHPPLFWQARCSPGWAACTCAPSATRRSMERWAG